MGQYYPEVVPDDVEQEIQNDAKEKEKKKQGLCLNCVPGLKGKVAR